MAMAIEVFKVEMSLQMKTLQNFFGNDEKKSLKFMSSVMNCMQANPKLLDCTTESLISCFMKMAEFDLYPSTVTGEAYILPYGRVAQFQLGYKGIITLLYRAGISSIYAEIVRKNDQIEVLGGMNPGIHHKIALEERGDAIGAYVVVDLKGEKIYKYMSKSEIMEFKKFSQSASSSNSAWNPAKDPELIMWKKTVIKQIAKTLPQNEAIAQAIAYDNEDSDISEHRKQAIIEQSKQDTGFKMANLLPKEEILLPDVEETETTEDSTTNPTETGAIQE